jgi:hypothetical protein
MNYRGQRAPAPAGYQNLQQRYPQGNQWGGNAYGAQGYNNQPARAAQSVVRAPPPPASAPANYYDAAPRRTAYAQPAPAAARQPVRRINTPQQEYNRSAWRSPGDIAVDEDSDYESTEFHGSSIRPTVQRSSAASVPKRPAPPTSSLKETALCLVSQSPSPIEITRLLKGDKGDQGEPGDSFFELTPDDPSWIRQCRGSNLRVTGKLSVEQLEVRRPSAPHVLAGGEATTGEDGQVTIQLPQELRGKWAGASVKPMLTLRERGGALFVPEDGLNSERNQLSVHCVEKQRVKFDWLLIQV